MKFVALVSGGKDSCFNILHCLAQGHELVALANLHPENVDKQELDSFMYQTVGHDILLYYSECCEVPMYRQAIKGTSKNQKLEYFETEEDETEDLYTLLTKVLEDHPEVEAVSVGAILSSYQRTRVEHVCQRLGLVSLAFLWQRDQAELLEEMCQSSMDARIIKVAAAGLNSSHLNKTLPEMLPIMTKLNRMYDVHICGEGGEFETMVLDAPFFKHKKLEVVAKDIIEESGDVCYAKLTVQPVPKEYKEVSLLDEVQIPSLLREPFQEIYEDLGLKADEDNECDVVEDTSTDISLVDTQVRTVGTKLFVSNLKSQKSGLKEQTEDIFSQLSEILKNNNLEFRNIQSSQLLVKSMADFSAVNVIYSSFFTAPLPPSRICVETRLPPSNLLQLSVTVMRNPQAKKGVHIQGRSYWAPANIGPYSQAIIDTGNSIASISGQIPLIPATMEPEAKDFRMASALSLQHFDSIKNLISVTKTAATICFTTSSSFLQPLLDAYHAYDPAASSSRFFLVRVTQLPRGTPCEWGGFVYKESISVHDSDSDSDSDSNSFQNNGLGLQRINETIFDVKMVYSTQEQDQLFKSLKTLNQDVHIICYSTVAPVGYQGLSIEYVPVVEAFDSTGQPCTSGLIIRAD